MGSNVLFMCNQCPLLRHSLPATGLTCHSDEAFNVHLPLSVHELNHSMQVWGVVAALTTFLMTGDMNLHCTPQFQRQQCFQVMQTQACTANVYILGQSFSSGLSGRMFWAKSAITHDQICATGAMQPIAAVHQSHLCWHAGASKTSVDDCSSAQM